MSDKVCGNCGADLIEVPLFTSVEWKCPFCQRSEVPKAIQDKIDEQLKKTFQYPDQNSPPNSDTKTFNSNDGLFGTVITPDDFS